MCFPLYFGVIVSAIRVCKPLPLSTIAPYPGKEAVNDGYTTYEGDTMLYGFTIKTLLLYWVDIKPSFFHTSNSYAPVLPQLFTR
jgi:hypothetical protein